MDKETIAQAKKNVKNQFGEAFAKKASDEFCLYFTGADSPRTRSFGVEAITASTSASVAPTGMILEFKNDAPVKKVQSTRAKADTKKIAEMLDKMKGKEEIAVNIQQILNQNRIQSFREKVVKGIHPLNAQIERNIEREFAHGLRSLQQQSFLTKICWLNQTVCTIANPRSMAEVAADPLITKLDMPRKLSREIKDTGKLLFAEKFRKKFSFNGKGIIAAVIDSEIAIGHTSFGKRVMHRNNYTKEPWGNPDSHGTAVAGIVGSSDKNFSGMAPGITIYNYKVLATEESLNADDFGGTLAIQKALEDGANIANCSWGAGPAGDGTSREARACNTAWDLGLTIVKSAGNKGPGKSTLTTPADANGVIVVGATDKTGKKVASYSSRGPFNGGKRPHLLAPGGSDSGGIFSCQIGGGFADIGMGTSFAAPHVTGILALILQQQPSLSPDEQRNFLIKLCTKLRGPNVNTQGAGFLSLSSL